MSGDLVLFNAGNVAAGFACNLVILITFGAAYPPLAVMLTIAIWVDTLQWQAVIGRQVASFQLFHDVPSVINP